MTLDQYRNDLHGAAGDSISQIEIALRLAEDNTVDDVAFREFLLFASSEMFAGDFVSFVGSASRHRRFPSDEFWNELILTCRNDDVGLRLVPILVPFTPLTDFLTSLLKRARKSAPEENMRIAQTLWGACCVVSISLPDKDQFSMKSNLDNKRMKMEIQKVWNNFDQTGRDILDKCLKCLS